MNWTMNILVEFQFELHHIVAGRGWFFQPTTLYRPFKWILEDEIFNEHDLGNYCFLKGLTFIMPPQLWLWLNFMFQRNVTRFLILLQTHLSGFYKQTCIWIIAKVLSLVYYIVIIRAVLTRCVRCSKNKGG